MDSGNLFSGLPVERAAEEVLTLLVRPGVRIERIVSSGQASAPGFWYDQPETEWVVVLRGRARLRFAGEPRARELGPGDYVAIPARCRHRVDGTSAEEPTIWLAVFCPA